MKKKQKITRKVWDEKKGKYVEKIYKVDTPEELNLEWLSDLVKVIAIVAAGIWVMRYLL